MPNCISLAVTYSRPAKSLIAFSVKAILKTSFFKLPYSRVCSRKDKVKEFEVKTERDLITGNVLLF